MYHVLQPAATKQKLHSYEKIGRTSSLGPHISGRPPQDSTWHTADQRLEGCRSKWVTKKVTTMEHMGVS